MSVPCKVGDRIRLTAPIIDAYPPPGLPAGLEGTVNDVNTACGPDSFQVGVAWDNGRSLMLLPGDAFEVIS
jgi:hypothetical protein